MKLIIGFIVVAAMSSAFGADIKLQKVKTIGNLKDKVIFQSKDVKKLKNSNVVYGTIVAEWGFSVYEVATAYYTCNEKLYCELSEVKRVATYKSCIVKKNKAICTKKISGNSEYSSRDVVVENPDQVGPEFEERDSYGEYDYEFPVRIVDEFSGSF